MNIFGMIYVLTVQLLLMYVINYTTCITFHDCVLTLILFPGSCTVKALKEECRKGN